MFDWLVQLLFQYRPVVFAQGDIRFVPFTGAYAGAVLGVAAMLAAIASYRRVRAGSRARDRAVLMSLRLAVVGILVVCLFRPVLVVRAAVPQQNVVGVLVDDSLSMRIADDDGQARSAFVQRAFGRTDGSLLHALSDRYAVRMFRFSASAARAASMDEFRFDGRRSELAKALDQVRQEMTGLPLAGLVVVTDGVETGDTPLDEALRGLRAADVPVFTVGVGRESLPRDIQIDRVTAPASVLKGTSLLLDVAVSQTGYDGQPLTLDVEDEGRLVGTQAFEVSAGQRAVVRVRVAASEAGPRLFRFRVAPRPGELVAENNIRDTLIEVRDGREKILYFEGEPRPEMKFVRRAVADDPNLQLVVLQRTADHKFLRLDVDGPDELAAGFPATRDELFTYRGLVLGSVEAGAFTGDQLRMIVEFVDRRGGGLLMLGGPRAFGEGGYAGTPVAEVLPLAVERDRPGNRRVSRLTITPTRAGAAHAVTQIAATETASAARWKQLPPLTSVNAPGAIRPGATVLLEGTDEGGRTQPVLVSQPFGRGKALAFAVQDSWLWQMHASIPVDDQTHEQFWRQTLRWLTDGASGVVELHTRVDPVEPNEPWAVTAYVVGPTFVALNDARVVAHVTGAAGSTLDVPLQRRGEQPGDYRGSAPPLAEGLYEIRVEASRGGEPPGVAVAHVRAAPGNGEHFDPKMRASVLQRIARETGGRFYTPGNVSSLPDDLRYAGRGVTTVEERDLWHMPIVLALLVALTCTEWGYRRAVGLA